MVQSHISLLLQKHARNTLSAAGQQQLEQWLEAAPENRDLFNSLNSEPEMVAALEKAGEFNAHKVWSTIKAQQPVNRQAVRPLRYLFMRYAAVAALLLIAGTGTWLWLQQSKSGSSAKHTAVRDMPPGHDGAILTLADGSQVVLDSAGNGKIAQQGSTGITKQNGAIIYEHAVHAATTAIANNTLQTPKGRQFQVTLPDGSKVWLNAASSLTYPAAFTGNERVVSLTGEAYFEIAASPGRPFIVHGSRQQVQVLGTHFNINAYDNEPGITTTLLQGSVKVVPVTVSSPLVLQPGEQAVLTAQLSLNSQSDVAAAIAWKNGYFNFNKATIPAIMRQVARWYDVEVEYDKAPAGKQFWGKIPRNASLAQLITILDNSSIHCRLDGNKLIVQP